MVCLHKPGQIFLPAAGHDAPRVALHQNERAPTVPNRERGDWAGDEQIFRDGGRHHENGVSASPRSAPTDDEGGTFSRSPSPMPMSSAAGSQPPGAATKSEALTRPHHRRHPHDGEPRLHPHVALAQSVRPRDADRRNSPSDDAAARPPLCTH